MANEQKNGVSLKLLMDKKKNIVVFAECDSDFVNVLFSFLTIPMGKVVSLFPEKTFGCFKNLYQSVEKIDIRHFHFQTNACKSMLLHPRNAAEKHCADLKLKIDYSDPTTLYICSRESCRRLYYSRRSHYADAPCPCNMPMNHLIYSEKTVVAKDGSVFVKGENRFIITDDLRVTLVSTEAILSLFSKHGITSNSDLGEWTLTLDTNQVKTMFMYSLISRKVLSKIFLSDEQDLKPSSTGVSSFKLSSSESASEEESSNIKDVEAIRVKLIICKSKRKICYAEGSRDFVNLLFSFLTVPIGHIAKQIHGESFLNMCIEHLYRSALDLDDHCLRTIDEKQMLVSPSISHGFNYGNRLLGFMESFFDSLYDVLQPDEGFLTDCLKVTLISAFVCFTILKDLNVRSDDIIEHVVHVGKNEALLLLVNSFLTKNPLTSTFFKKPKQEH